MSETTSTSKIIDRGQGTPIVFLHGTLMTRKSFEPQVARLRRDYRTIAVDSRARRHDLPGQYTVADTVEDTLALLDGLGIGQCVLVGASTGGYTALEFALAHRDRLIALALIGAGAAAPPAVHDISELRAALGIDGMLSKNVADWWAEQAFGPVARSADHTTLDYWIGRWQRIPCRSAYYEIGSWLDLTDRTPLLREIDVPTLVVHGRDDTFFPLDISARPLAEQLPQCHFEIIDDAGNTPALEAPRAVNSTLLRFMRGLVY